MNKKELEKLAKNLYLKTDDQVLNSLLKEGDALVAKLNFLEEIDTDKIEPMTRIDNTPIGFLREDVIKQSDFSQNNILQNAPEITGDFVSLNREVKSD